jgi:hypothetical protein
MPDKQKNKMEELFTLREKTNDAINCGHYVCMAILQQHIRTEYLLYSDQYNLIFSFGNNHTKDNTLSDYPFTYFLFFKNNNVSYTETV